MISNQRSKKMFIYANSTNHPIQEFLLPDVEVKQHDFKDAYDLDMDRVVIRENTGKLSRVVSNGNGGKKFSSTSIRPFKDETINGERICFQCHKIKDEKHFVSGIRVDGASTKRCGHCRDYNLSKGKASGGYDSFRFWVEEQKMNDITILGCCGGDDCPLRKDIPHKLEWYEYDHLVQETKSGFMSRWNWWACPKHYKTELGFSSAKEAWLAERDKCRLMCTMCHQSHTKVQRNNTRKRSRIL